jgi:pimeloyl-ACP methyl ester carboxylesterase
MSRVERWVEVPGGRLWSRSDGNGPPIVLLHAGIADGTIWEPFVPLLTRSGYCAIWYDLRGYGRSEAQDVEYRAVDDLLAVLDVFDVGQACLVGNSLGGMAALDLAVTQPERVAALALLASGLRGYDPERSERDREVRARYDAVDAAGDIEALTDFELNLWGSGVGQPADRLRADLRAVLRPMIAASNDATRVDGRPVPLDPPAGERLASATMPVLFVHGGLDFSYFETIGHHLATTLADARVVVIPDVAHLIAFEAPERTAELVLDLVRPLGIYG